MATGFKYEVENCTDSGLKQSKKAKTTKLRPLNDRVLVRVTEPKEVMKNGILLPDNAVEKPQEGEVLAVGNGRVVNGERIPVDVEIGSVVVFGKYSGNDVEILGEKLLLLQESELMGEFYDA